MKRSESQKRYSDEKKNCRNDRDHSVRIRPWHFAEADGRHSGKRFPEILQQLDLTNYFGRLAIWILLATAISIHAGSPLRAGVNTLAFFIRMLTGYYLYCRFVSGFLPKAYLTIWVRISFLSFFPAYVC